MTTRVEIFNAQLARNGKLIPHGQVTNQQLQDTSETCFFSNTPALFTIDDGTRFAAVVVVLEEEEDKRWVATE